MEQLELKSLAKINLGLDVLGTREDGYHEEGRTGDRAEIEPEFPSG